MGRNIIILLALIFSLPAFSQSDSSVTDTSFVDPEPKRPLGFILQEILDQDFSEDILESLSQQPVTYVFNVDKEGDGRLSYMLGVENDSLRALFSSFAAEKIKFTPATHNGEVVNSNYYYNIYFDRILERKRYHNHYMLGLHKYTREDFSILNLSSKSMEMVFAALYQPITGPLQEHVTGMGGMQIGLNFWGSTWGGGMHMQVISLQKNSNFPISDERKQNENPALIHAGINIGKKIHKSPKRLVSLIANINYSSLNVIPYDEETETKGKSIGGPSVGAQLNVNWFLGGGRTAADLARTVWARGSINGFIGLKFMQMNTSRGSAVVGEIGIGYTLSQCSILSYRLTDEAFKR